MGRENAIDEALELLKQRKQSDLLSFRTSFVFIILGIILIGSELYFISKADYAKEVSLKVSKSILEENAEQTVLIDAIDTKLELLRKEINLSDGYKAIYGVFSVFFGFLILVNYPRKRETNQVLERLLRELDGKNS